MTIGELKELIKDVPDDSYITFGGYSAVTGDYHELVYRSGYRDSLYYVVEYLTGKRHPLFNFTFNIDDKEEEE